MNIKRLNSSRRNFFTKIGLGAGAGFLISFIPFKKAIRDKSISVTNSKFKVKINPLAVKRKK